MPLCWLHVPHLRHLLPRSLLSTNMLARHAPESFTTTGQMKQATREGLDFLSLRFQLSPNSSEHRWPPWYKLQVRKPSPCYIHSFFTERRWTELRRAIGKSMEVQLREPQLPLGARHLPPLWAPNRPSRNAAAIGVAWPEVP